MNTADALMLEATVRGCIEKLRSAEFQNGPECMTVGNIPDSNCSISDLSCWLEELVSVAMKQQLALSKHVKHRFGSHTEKAIKKDTTAIAEKLKLQNTITRTEYNFQLAHLNQSLSRLLDMVETLSKNSCENTRMISRYQQDIKKIEALICKLQSKKVIADDEAVAADASTHPIIPTDSITPTNSTNSTNTTNHTDSTNITAAEDESGSHTVKNRHSARCNGKKELNQTLNNVLDNKKETHSVQNCNAENGDNRANMDSNGEENLKLEPVCDGFAVDPDSEAFIKVWEISKRRRITEIIHESISTLKTFEASVMTFHGPNGEAFEIHPATAPELILRNELGNIVARLDQDLILSPDTPSREKEKAKLCAKYHYSKTLQNILTVDDGVLLLSPTEFMGQPRRIYGMRPMFVGNSISEQHALKLVIDYMVLKSSKSGLATRNQLLTDGDYFSRQYIVEFITSMSRCFSSLAQAIRFELFKSCKVWHNDESTMKVLELLQEEDGSRRSKNYIWCLVTGSHEEKQGVVYLGSKTRSSEEFIKQFKDAETLEPDEFAIEALITDCYSGYPPGIALLEDMLEGRHIVHAGCFFHLRKYFIEALSLLKLDKVFRKICTCPPDDYDEYLDRELQNQNIAVGSNGDLVLFMTYLIELILRLDGDFSNADRKELEARRQEFSVELLDQFYEECENLLRLTPTMHRLINADGKIYVEGGSEYPWGKALAYALNNRQELYAFTTNGDIACTNNIAERQIRPCVIHRGMMQFLQNADSFRGYVDIMTITQTCRLNNINPYTYIQWVIDNAKLRIEQYRCSGEHEGTSQLCKMPRTQFDDEGKRLSKYDERYDCVFDKISYKGLDPWSYKEIMKQEKMRRKK